MQYPDTDAVSRRVEAARYALLQRLTQSLRHRMLVHLQPIDMLTHVVERRLAQPEPDLRRVGADMGRVQGYARDAVQANLDVVTWLAPEPGRRVALRDGVDECMVLLRGYFAFRGFGLRHTLDDGAPQVPQSALRTLLPAVLIALMDAASATGELVVDAGPGEATLQVRCVPGAAPAPAVPPPERPLAWDEIEWLARAEGARIAHGPGSAEVSLPA